MKNKRRDYSKIIKEYYDSFIEELRKDKTRIAQLQIAGRQEDYLVNLFILKVAKETEGKIFGRKNLRNGNSIKEIDICFHKSKKPKSFRGGNENKNCPFCAFIEAKYIFQDEITEKLKAIENDLKKSNEIGDTYKGYEIRGEKKVIGLIFFSFINDTTDENKEKYEKAVKTINAYGKFSNCLSTLEPLIKPVYENEKINVLETDFFVSLYSGLWVLKE